MLSTHELTNAVEKFYKNSISLSEIQKGITRIDTPFLDRHNDSLIVYAIKENDTTLRLTDGGYVLDDLEADGIFLFKSKRRVQILKDQLTNYSVSLNEDTHELFVRTTLKDYPSKQGLLIQAMLFTNDMFMLSNKKVKSIFITEVANFFEESNIRVTDGPNIIGPSGMIHHYEFSIPGIRDIPEKLIKTMNTANNEYYARAITTDKIQTQSVRPNTEFYTFINDENEVDDSIINLFNSEGITPVLFSNRQDYTEQLAK